MCTSVANKILQKEPGMSGSLNPNPQLSASELQREGTALDRAIAGDHWWPFLARSVGHVDLASELLQSAPCALCRSCSIRKPQQSSMQQRHVCRAQARVFARPTLKPPVKVTQQQESCQAALSQRKRNWNRYSLGICYCDAVYLPCSTTPFSICKHILCCPSDSCVRKQRDDWPSDSLACFSQVWAQARGFAVMP